MAQHKRYRHRRGWLIATDLDGTIVRPDKTVSRRTVEVLRGRVDLGDHVLFLTGRSPRDDRSGLPVELLTGQVMVCANGAVDYDPATDRVLRVETLNRPAMELITRVCREQFPGGWFAADALDSTVIEAGHPWARSMAPSFRTVPDVLEPRSVSVPSDDHDPYKVTYLHPAASVQEMIMKVEPLVSGQVSLTYGSTKSPCFLEFAAPGVSKGAALARHAASWGISADRVISFGDMPNDVSMFAVSGQSWAMADAPDVVRRLASGTTGGVLDDGVAAVLDGLDPLPA